MKSLKHKISGFVFILALALLWEVLSHSDNSPIFFPPFTEVIKTLFSLFYTSEFILHIFSSLSRCFVGFLFAIFVSVPFGLILGRMPKLFNVFEMFIEFFRPMPSAALIPIAILFLGIDNEMKIFIIFFGSSWPILINTIDGVKSIEPMYIVTSKVFGFSKIKTFIRVALPASLPAIFTGLRISIAIALILTITVEMIVGGNGIGYYILDAERSFHFKEMYAGVLTIGILGYIINNLFVLLERRIVFWNNKYIS